MVSNRNDLERLTKRCLWVFSRDLPQKRANIVPIYHIDDDLDAEEAILREMELDEQGISF